MPIHPQVQSLPNIIASHMLHIRSDALCFLDLQVMCSSTVLSSSALALEVVACDHLMCTASTLSVVRVLTQCSVDCYVQSYGAYKNEFMS